MLDETRRADAPSGADAGPDVEPFPPVLEVFGEAPLGPPAAPAPGLGLAHADVGARLAAVEAMLAGLARQAAFVPPKLRGLGERVDALATALAHARSRDLLTELCAMDDLVAGGLAARAGGDAEAPARVLLALASTLGALLEAQGVTETPTSGAFDPTLQRAVRALPVDDPDCDGLVVEVDRRGFLLAGKVLRFADVAVGRHGPPEGGEP